MDIGGSAVRHAVIYRMLTNFICDLVFLNAEFELMNFFTLIHEK